MGQLAGTTSRSDPHACRHGHNSSRRSINPRASLLGNCNICARMVLFAVNRICDSLVSSVLFQIFSGLLVNLPSVMGWLNWLKYFSIPRYGLTVSRKQHWSPVSNVATLLLPREVLSINEVLLEVRFGFFPFMNTVEEQQTRQPPKGSRS